MSKNANHHMKYILGGMAIVLTGALMRAVIPDLRRYRRMRDM